MAYVDRLDAFLLVKGELFLTRISCTVFLIIVTCNSFGPQQIIDVAATNHKANEPIDRGRTLARQTPNGSLFLTAFI